MHITLVAPRLLGIAPEALASVDALSRLAGLARPDACVDLDTALVSEFATEAMTAPLAALGAGVEVGTRWVMRADPVRMSVGHDDVRIDGLVDDLDAEAAQALAAMLNAHFASDALVFEAPRADAWFVASEIAFDLMTTPLDAAIGRPLRGLLPEGADASRWRRWLTEAQMLLHGQAITGSSGEAVNGLWFSGGGVLPGAALAPTLHVSAVPGRQGDLVRGMALQRGGIAGAADSLDSALRGAAAGDAVVAVLAPVDTQAALEAATQRFLAPALARLDRGDASSLTLLADGPHGAARWHAQRVSLFKRIARRRAKFAAPVEA